MPATAIKDSTDASTVKYGSYTFPVLRSIRFASQPIYDAAGRASRGTRYEVAISFFVFGDTESELATSMSSIRSQLMKPGRLLTLQNVGVGLETIGPGGVDADISFGPRPISLTVEPMGGVCNECVWIVEFLVDHCASSGSSISSGSAAPIELNYAVSFSIDEMGIATRSIAGICRVRANRATVSSNRVVSRVEDLYARLRFDKPPNFRRVRTERTIAPDRTYVTFNIVDKEVDGPALPRGIIDSDLSYGIRNIGVGFAKHRATLSGSITVAPGYHPNVAASHFMQILASRVIKLRQIPSGATGGSQGSTVMPVSFSVSRALFGPSSRTTHFSVEMDVVGGSISDAFKLAGIWEDVGRPIAGDYDQWAKSMRQLGHWSNHGWTGGKLSPEDTIIGSCEATVSFDVGKTEMNTVVLRSPDSLRIFSCDPAIIAYENHFLYEIKRKERRVDPVQSPYKYASRGGPGYYRGIDVEGIGVPMDWETEPTVQEYSPPEEYVVMYGRALGLGLPVPPPNMTTWAGRDVELGGRGSNDSKVDVEVVADVFGCKLYLTRWAKRYRIKGKTTRNKPVRVPDNTAQNFNSEEPK